MAHAHRHELILLFSFVVRGLFPPAVTPTDRFAWFLEALLVLIAIPLTLQTR